MDLGRANGWHRARHYNLRVGCNEREAIACDKNRTIETEGVVTLKVAMRNVSIALADANRAAGTNIKVGAVMFDCESSRWGIDINTPNGQPEYIDGITRRNELLYNTTREIFTDPAIRIMFCASSSALAPDYS